MELEVEVRNEEEGQAEKIIWSPTCTNKPVRPKPSTLTPSRLDCSRSRDSQKFLPVKEPSTFRGQVELVVPTIHLKERVQPKDRPTQGCQCMTQNQHLTRDICTCRSTYTPNRMANAIKVLQ